MKYLIPIFIFATYSAIAEEGEFLPIETILKGFEYQALGQSRYSLGKTAINGKSKYPKCRKIFNQIYSMYQGPDIVQKYFEESVFTHRRVWKKKNQSLSLKCFERNGIRFAEWVSVYET